MRNIVMKFLKRKEPFLPALKDFVQVRKEDITNDLSDSWKDDRVPQQQYEICTKEEINNYKNKIPVLPFDVFIDILKENIPNLDDKTILEIGCSSGYYSEVLKIKGIKAEYHGCDYSSAFIEFAKELYPGLDFQVQEACGLSYPDCSFDIIVSGCCLLHIMDYEKAIAEAARTAKEYVVFHRTPVLHRKETSYYVKTAYGVRMFEIHFNERELLGIMRKNGLRVEDIITFNAFVGDSDFFAYKTFLCSKG
jgi:SAM-dependent methyltransferase